MTNTPIELEVENRTSGRNHCRGLRRKGMIPGNIYGPKMENLNISIDERLVTKYSQEKYMNQNFQLKIKGKEGSPFNVLIKNITVDPASRKPIHIDFFHPDSNKKIKIKVNLSFDGKAKGVADGGFLQIRQKWVKVQCWPHEIPETLNIDVTQMGIGNTMRVVDIKPVEGIHIITNPNVALISLCN